jgi:hypothetical protein
MTDLPQNLNDYNAWIDRGDIKEAMDALRNQVTSIVGNEQTAQMLVKQLRQEQDAQNAQLARTLERIVFELRDDLSRTLRRFDALDKQIATIGAHLVSEDKRLDELEAHEVTQH